jgi:tetratricopeptide (TPR) repeat protein
VESSDGSLGDAIVDSARSRILDDFPTPVAYTYSLIFDEGRNASVRRWALCFTEYQALRLIALPLVGQYLRADLSGIDFLKDKASENALRSLNKAIAGIRAPFFSDWITLVETLRDWMPTLGLTPLFPSLAPALKQIKAGEPREFDLSGERKLAPLRAILALRNGTAHGAIPDEAEAARHLEVYLPVLHQVLDAFDFLGESRLLVRQARPEEPVRREETVRELRGVRPGEPIELELSDDQVAAFLESPAVLVGPDGRVEPLYPLLNPQPEIRPGDDRETIYLYDGHHGKRVETKGETVEKGAIHYLGVHHRALDTPSCTRMKELLLRRQVDFFLPKEKVAPWTIAETAADYSRNLTLAEMRGSKYLPGCYVPFPELERHFDAFLAARPPRAGVVLSGLAGSGKSAFLAQRVARLLEPDRDAIPQDPDVRDNPNLVFFLRGSGIAPRAGGLSLYRDVAEKLGISTHPGSGIATFGELLAHLNTKWKDDRVAGRRLILVIDGLNEAPEPRAMLAEALAMIVAAGSYPWCKIAVSTRLEWLRVWSDKMTAQESAPLEQARRFLYHDETRDRPGQPADPVLTVEPFTLDQAAEVYAHYRASAGTAKGVPVPACTTPWEALPAATRTLLINPLHLHLFMETFDGRPAEEVATIPALFRTYVDGAVREHPGLNTSIEAVIGHLRADLSRPSADLSDDDVNTIRATWAQTLTDAERQQRLHPVEDLAHEGWVHKRVREEGGGYRFTFQRVAEYLVYLDLRNSRPKAEDERTYWTRRAAPNPVFPEYAGAFAFLLRDWSRERKLGLAARIVETSPSWFDDVLVGFLIEQAQIEHAPGQTSPHARAAADALAENGGQWTARTLYNAGCDLMSTRFAPEAAIYYQESLSIREALWRENPSNIALGDGLGGALNNLGTLLRDAGRVDDAEAAYRRAVTLAEALWRENPSNVSIGDTLGLALNNLGTLLSDAGRVDDAEAAYRRSVEIREALWRENPSHIAIKAGYAGSLCDFERWDEAERLVEEVLAVVPAHPYANQLKSYIVRQRRSP